MIPPVKRKKQAEAAESAVTAEEEEESADEEEDADEEDAEAEENAETESAPVPTKAKERPAEETEEDVQKKISREL